MHTEKTDALIIGGGLSGLYTAYLLSQKKKPFVLLEARSRLGGRILSPAHDGYFVDMGPSWYWPAINPGVSELVEMLGLEGYPQFETGLGRLQARDGHVETIAGYPMDPPGWRIHGGMYALVKGLLDKIPEKTLRLSHPVCEIRQQDDGIRVIAGRHDQAPIARFTAGHVILALPPRLAAGSILFTPDLPHDLTQAMLKASTWMAGQAKFFALYDAADWREKGLSGQGFSMYGPMGELHDASEKAGAPYGLTGFVGVPALRRRDEKTMVDAILPQLTLMFGHAAGHPIRVFYQDWAREEFTATEYDQRAAHNHPEFHPPSGKTGIWHNTLHFAGTETADDMGGYLEGALSSARRAVSQIG